jgi:hypothetical protein
VADTATEAQRLGDFIDEDAQVTFAGVDEAVVQLITGEAYDLVLCEARAAREGNVRRRLARMAPETTKNFFAVRLAEHRVVSGAGGHVQPRQGRDVVEERLDVDGGGAVR